MTHGFHSVDDSLASDGFLICFADSYLASGFLIGVDSYVLIGFQWELDSQIISGFHLFDESYS